MWDLRIVQMNFSPKHKQTHRPRKQTYDYHRGEGERESDKLWIWD